MFSVVLRPKFCQQSQKNCATNHQSFSSLADSNPKRNTSFDLSIRSWHKSVKIFCSSIVFYTYEPRPDRDGNTFLWSTVRSVGYMHLK